MDWLNGAGNGDLGLQGTKKEKKEASRAKYRNVEKRCEVANLMVLLVNVGPNILSILAICLILIL